MTVEDPIEFLHGHKKCIVNQRELGSDAQTFAPGPEGRAAPGPRRDPRRRDARPRDDLDRADRGRDRPPRLRHAAHAGRAADDRPHHRRLPRPPAAPGARAALGRAAGRHDPAAAADRRRLGPRRGLRGARARRPAVRNLIREGKTHQIYSAHADRLAASACRRWTPRWPTLVRAGKITQRLAESRSSTPEELRRLLGSGGMAGGLIAWPPTSSRRWTSPGAKADRARSRPTTKQVVADQLKARGLIVLDIKAKHGSKEISLDFLQAGQGRPT